jgi:hypothetical protein
MAVNVLNNPQHIVIFDKILSFSDPNHRNVNDVAEIIFGAIKKIMLSSSICHTGNVWFSSSKRLSDFWLPW